MSECEYEWINIFIFVHFVAFVVLTLADGKLKVSGTFFTTTTGRY